MTAYLLAALGDCALLALVVAVGRWAFGPAAKEDDQWTRKWTR